MRSNILSKLIFSSCVGYSDRAYYGLCVLIKDIGRRLPLQLQCSYQGQQGDVRQSVRGCNRVDCVLLSGSYLIILSVVGRRALSYTGNNTWDTVLAPAETAPSARDPQRQAVTSLDHTDHVSTIYSLVHWRPWQQELIYSVRLVHCLLCRSSQLRIAKRRGGRHADRKKSRAPARARPNTTAGTSNHRIPPLSRSMLRTPL